MMNYPQPQYMPGPMGWQPNYQSQPTRGRVFQRGRGGRMRKTKPKPPPAEVQKTEARPVEVPAPKYLSKTASKEVNDPLYKEAWFPEPGSDLGPSAEPLYVYPSCEALPIISEVTYKEAVASKQGFAKRVSEAAFAYYCAVLTYQRLLRLYRDNQFEISSAENSFIKQVDDGNYIVPTVLSTYLSGFGNTTMPCGREIKFSLRRPEFVRAAEIPGWFGQVNEQTHYLYKSYPCLAVYAYRILQDLGLEEEGDEGDEEGGPAPHQDEWDLPQALRPAGNAGRPTENLLGWRRAERLNPEKRIFLQQCGVVHDVFPSTNTAVCFNHTLMNGIKTELGHVERLTFQEVSVLPSGSQGQLTLDIFDNRLGIMHEVRQQCVTQAVFGPLGPASYIGGSFVYRTRHNVEARRKPWSIYSWRQYQGVPAAWTETINTLRQDEPEELGLDRYRTRPFYVLDRVKFFSDKEVNIKPPP